MMYKGERSIVFELEGDITLVVFETELVVVSDEVIEDACF